MNHTLKLFLIYFFAFFILFAGSQYILDLIFPEMDHLYKLIGSGVFTIILCPRLQKVKTEDGTRLQLKWLFKKEPLIK
ncbi:hypothetical protein G3I01_16435 [Gramella sp. MT6]|uniref:hypothetical protein n=1 Tax=Gramella sp. MT6 TaxID=2705471 RepID=UPI001C5EFD2B|nr:hypothetical protein [Gramella sp. MT6]QYA27014.1 hypothetical protein G3I01_16435 [Gramella sp. MT6]